MAEESRQRQWLRVNWEILLRANIPAMKVVDKLVPRGVYDPCDDDYQCIQKGLTTPSKARTLLETISTKTAGDLENFKQALQEVCPHVLASCVNQSCSDTLKELRDTTNFYYRENLKVRPLTWLKGAEPVSASTFILNLSVVEKTVVESMMSHLVSSSVNEIERQEYLYSQPSDQTLVPLYSLFPQFQTEQTCKQGATESPKSDGALVVDETNVAVAGANNPSPVVSDGKGNNPCVLQSAQHVGIYGGAGCGKTSCLMKAANMYAEGALWQNARLLLFWKLRDPKVQNADSLKELLRQLKLTLTDDKYKQFSDVLEASSGEKVILALDGVDELDPKKKGYVRSLLDGSALPKACVLATSRSCSTAKTYFDKYEANLELLGFTESQVDEFIQQQLGNKPELVSELHQILVENPTLSSLMLVPMLAMMVCQVFRLATEKPAKTRTALYSKLLCLVLKRTVEESEGRVGLSAAETSRALEVSEVLKLKGTAKTLMSELARVAFLAHNQRKAIFGHDLVDEASCSDEALKVGLLCRNDADDGLDIVRQYSFQHLTVQEFLVAYRLVAHTTSEQAVKDKVSELVSSRHNHVVLQFFAGLLAESLRPHFFACLNQWLHKEYFWEIEECQSRLRVCLQCAKEACGENGDDFPSALQLPDKVILLHVTAPDLTQLSLAVAKSQHIVDLTLYFDEVEILIDSEKKKVSRVKTQTRRAMTRLMRAVSENKSLRQLMLHGPKYSLFEEEGWRLLVKTVENNCLEWLHLVCCELDNTPFHFLSNALKHNTQLNYLWLYDNSLNDVSARTLAKDLEHNNTLKLLNLTENSYGEGSRKYLQCQLRHICRLDV